ncbi:MAG: rhamnulose-1-phosphate aldolase [Bacteroidales bacterium]|nr:rhamnulose-1-phosphate aldolase [Bacteroidales bacterium]MCF8332749.1 rhamnulose-1-phosphate aldolase [Bacteroidales bacterium]
MKEWLEEQYKSIGKVAGYLWDKGWAERNAGNISVNITEFFSSEELYRLNKSSYYQLEKPMPALGGGIFLITAAGSRMRLVKEQPQQGVTLIELDESGRKYCILYPEKDNSPSFPTSEMPAHLAIHDFLRKEKRPGRTVLHAHVTETIALTHNPDFKDEENINSLLWSIQPETTLFIPDGVGFVPFRMPGSYDIAEATIEKMKTHKAIIWEKHGCVVVERNLEEAFDIMDIIAKSIDIYFKCRMAGYEPEGLSKKQIREITNRFHTPK